MGLEKHMTAPVSEEVRDPGRIYLVEVQGLRTIAALLVAIYHIWFQRVSGGVDVFFVVAAFFMIKSLTKTDNVSVRLVVDYYLSTLRRIMPGASLVILCTIVGIFLIVPSVSWTSEVRHALASLVFLENWHLARSNTDYLNQGQASSAFQQFWALSMQGQYYLVFPIVLLLTDRLARLLRQPLTRMILFTFGAIFACSFVYSVYRTAVNQPFTYFDSLARAWEFAAGVIAGVMFSSLRLPRRQLYILGVIALAIMLTFARVIDASMLFPGYVTLVPVAVALVIILASQAHAQLPLLSWKPVAWAGDYSFAFYLWHWPLLIFTSVLIKSDDIGLLTGLAIIILAALLAYVSTRWLETPFRRNSLLSRRPLLAVLGGAAIAAVPFSAAVGWHLYIKELSDSAHKDIATFLSASQVPAGDRLVPHPILARGDLPAMYFDGCHYGVRVCTYGQQQGKRTVVLVGGSHSAQWLPPLQALAQRRDLRIISMTMSTCSFKLGADEHDGLSPACTEWADNAVAEIRRLKPDLVFTIVTRPGDGHDYVPTSYRRAWAAMQEDGIKIVGLRDNPWFESDIPYCVELNRNDPDRCAIRRSAFYGPDNPALVDAPGNMTVLDFTDEYCDAGLCRPVKDQLLRYRDSHHLTRTFAMTFIDRIDVALVKALNEPEAPPAQTSVAAF